MKKIFSLGLIIIVISACMTSKRVTYREMTKQPNVQIIDDNKIIVHTDNSWVNSALFIYKIKYSIDTVKKEINLIGYQTLWKKYKNKFEIKIKGQSKSQLDKFNYFWIDPDNKKTMIEKIK